MAIIQHLGAFKTEDARTVLQLSRYVLWTEFRRYGEFQGRFTLSDDDLIEYGAMDVLDESSIHGFFGSSKRLQDYLEEHDAPMLASAVAEWPSAQAYIAGLNVHPDARRAGLGGQLLDQTVKTLRETHGVRSFFLHAAPEVGYESQLIAFYQRHGFRKLELAQDDLPLSWTPMFCVL